MPTAELIVALLFVVAVLAGFARLVRVPYPVVLVVGGLVIALVPGAPRVSANPDLIFFVFLPPLLYSAAFLAPAYELRHYARPILVLAVGLVLVTVITVAAVAHWVVGMPWGPAFILGAVLGPTDAISATSILRRLGAPRRIAIIVESDALVNDGTALVAYRIAIGALGASAFSLPQAAGEFIGIALGGAAIGLLVGWLSARVRQAFDEARIEITVSLLTPFAAYIPAERIGVSGVLAVVVAGLYVGRREMEIFSADTRLRYDAVWEVLTFLLNSVLFLLIGLQLRTVIDAMSPVPPTGQLVAYAALISAVVLVVRLAWTFTVAPLVDALPRSRIALSWPERLVLGWSGMRGGLSLAAALATPLSVAGAPVSHRDLLIFLTFSVVVVTLLLPGLTLPALLQHLGLGEAEPSAKTGTEARAEVARAALARLQDLSTAGATSPEVVSQARAVYEGRLRRLEAEMHGDENESADLDAYGRLRAELLEAERDALAHLRTDRVPDELVRDIEHELDLEEARVRRHRGGEPATNARARRQSAQAPHRTP